MLWISVIANVIDFDLIEGKSLPFLFLREENQHKEHHNKQVYIDLNKKYKHKCTRS